MISTSNSVNICNRRNSVRRFALNEQRSSCNSSLRRQRPESLQPRGLSATYQNQNIATVPTIVMLASHQASSRLALDETSPLIPRARRRTLSLQKQQRNSVNLSVNGRPYSLRIESILREPRRIQQSYTTILEDIAKTVRLNASYKKKQMLCHTYDNDNDVFHIYGRAIPVFEAVLRYHWNGRLHMPKIICPYDFWMELDFWKTAKEAVCICCAPPSDNCNYDSVPPDEPISPMAYNDTVVNPAEAYVQLVTEEIPRSQSLNFSHYKKRSDSVDESATFSEETFDKSVIKTSLVGPKKSHRPKKIENMTNTEAEIDTAMFIGILFGKERLAIWKFLENPNASKGAKVFAGFSVTIALISILIMIIGSLPDYQVKDPVTNTSEPISLLKNMELSCIVWFTIEYIVRLLVTGKKWVYIKGALQIVDLLTILPSYLEVLLEYTNMDVSKFGSLKGAFLVLRLLRVLRVMRVFRLARYHTGLKQLGETLQASKREIGVLFVFFSSTVLLFATSVYYLEKDEEGTQFISIPAACWWCVITITTVGYGDLVPKTVGGQLVATVACLAGIIVLAFPITMIIENFNVKYKGGDDEDADADPNRRIIRCKF